MKLVLSWAAVIVAASIPSTTKAQSNYVDALKTQAQASAMEAAADHFHRLDQNQDFNLSWDEIAPNSPSMIDFVNAMGFIAKWDDNRNFQLSEQEYLRPYARIVASDQTDDAAPDVMSEIEDDRAYGAPERLLALQLQHATSVFTLRDVNKDGLLSGTEVTNLMSTCLSTIDENGDEAISLDEMLSPFSRSAYSEPTPVDVESDRKKRISLIQNSVAMLFQDQDANNDGLLVASELPQAYFRHRRMIDKNLDGAVDKLELIKYTARRRK